MTGKILTALAMIAGFVGSTVVHATEPSDSTKVRELEEVSVEAANQRAYVDRTVYHPTKQQKKFAMNGIQLISLMGIPQLNASIAGGTVTTAAGEDVAFFINSTPADKNDLAGIRMDDVVDVEYLMYPTDPRFMGAHHAVNFIVRIPEYGGYTRLAAEGNTISPYSCSGSVFSKFSYKRMVFDAYASAYTLDRRGCGVSDYEQFRFTDPQGAPVRAVREQVLDKTVGHYNLFPVSFRATYNSSRLQVRNAVGYSHSDLSDTQKGTLRISPSRHPDNPYTIDNTSRSNSIAYAGNMYLVPASNWAINLALSASYSHNNKDYLYESSLTEGDPIEQLAYDNSYKLGGSLDVSRQFGIHNIGLKLEGADYHSKVIYRVPSYDDRFREYDYSAQVSYSMNLAKVRFYAHGGWASENNVVNGRHVPHSYPFALLDVNWLPAPRHQFSISFNYAATSPDENVRTPNIFQSNEFMWRTGNPDIRFSHQTTGNISYTWLPSNNLNLTASYGNYYSYGRMTRIYAPYEGKGVISKLVNNGDSYYDVFSLYVTWRLFSGKLQIQAFPKFVHWKGTGINSRNLSAFDISIQPLLYLGNFFIAPYYMSPSRIYKESGNVVRNTDNYGLVAGWSSSWGLRLQVRVANIFDKDRKAHTTSYDSEYYSMRQDVFNPDRRCVKIQAQYTFSYGKKMRQGDEVGKLNGAASGIF